MLGKDFVERYAQENHLTLQEARQSIQSMSALVVKVLIEERSLYMPGIGRLDLVFGQPRKRFSPLLKDIVIQTPKPTIRFKIKPSILEQLKESAKK